MKLAIFDFDGTLYAKDSLIEIWKFFLKKHPLILLYFPVQFIGLLLFKLKLINAKRFKELFVIYLFRKSPERIGKDLEEFWTREYPSNFHEELLKFLTDIKSGGLKTVCLSASPNLFLQPICNVLQIDELISTLLVQENGKYRIKGKNCRGDEKVRRLKDHFKDYDIELEYVFSDNRDDLELRKMAKQGYEVIGGKVLKI